MRHNFGREVYKDDKSEEKYKQCEDCGVVMFVENENPCFNLECTGGERRRSREDLRDRLEVRKK